MAASGGSRAPSLPGERENSRGAGPASVLSGPGRIAEKLFSSKKLAAIFFFPSPLCPSRDINIQPLLSTGPGCLSPLSPLHSVCISEERVSRPAAKMSNEPPVRVMGMPVSSSPRSRPQNSLSAATCPVLAALPIAREALRGQLARPNWCPHVAMAFALQTPVFGTRDWGRFFLCWPGGLYSARVSTSDR